MHRTRFVIMAAMLCVCVFVNSGQHVDFVIIKILKGLLCCPPIYAE